jgi:hypothetical protein
MLLRVLGRRGVIIMSACLTLLLCLALLRTERGVEALHAANERVIQPAKDKVKEMLPGQVKEEYKQPTKIYKPTPTYTPPPVVDPFPLLATSTPPPIPSWNVPARNAHRAHNLTVAPPLLIGFTRSWPLLLQCVTSYIAAGWPAGQIYVVENTGVQQANARGLLTLQNPFYLNHSTLLQLGVNVLQTPTLLSFAQLQNYYLSLTYTKGWPYFFWSHMDVLALSFEDGEEGVTPPYDQPGYKPLYTLALEALADALKNGGDRWAMRFFAYDHLTLVNPAAWEAVGAWDTLIPYYMTDCDMHSRLELAGWKIEDRKAGRIHDVNTALRDLSALYRLEGVPIEFVDPNPPPPVSGGEEEPAKKGWWRRRRQLQEPRRTEAAKRDEPRPPHGPVRRDEAGREYYRQLRATADAMFHYKAAAGRNTWQAGQKGGVGEAFAYPAEGTAVGIDVLTEAGREVFRRKWGHRDCDIIKAGYTLEDQWRVERDWRD